MAGLDFMAAIRSRARAVQQSARTAGRSLTETEASAPYAAASELAGTNLYKQRALTNEATAEAARLGLGYETLEETKRSAAAKEAETIQDRLMRERVAAATLAEQQRTREAEEAAAEAANKRETTSDYIQGAIGAGNLALKTYDVGNKAGWWTQVQPTTDTYQGISPAWTYTSPSGEMTNYLYGGSGGGWSPSYGGLAGAGVSLLSNLAQEGSQAQEAIAAAGNMISGYASGGPAGTLLAVTGAAASERAAQREYHGTEYGFKDYVQDILGGPTHWLSAITGGSK